VRGARKALLLAAVPLLVAASPQVSFSEAPRALIFLVDGLSYGQALDDPGAASVALRGGIGLMTPTRSPDELRGDLRGVADGRSVLLFPTSPRGLDDALRGALSENAMAERLLVLIVVPEPLPAMRGRSGEVTPLVMGRGDSGEPPSQLVLHGLTSATTRRDGVVSNADVVPTVLTFLGRPVPDDQAGASIRVSEEPPTDLLARYVEYRRVVTPVGVTVLVLALVALALCLLLLVGPWRSSPPVLRAMAVIGLVAVSLQVALLPASWLPAFYPAAVWSVLGLVAAVLLLAAVAAGRRSPFRAVAIVAGSGLALVVVDAALGWPSLLTPLLGGSALEGVRFYGLGNPYAGLVMAGAVLVASLLRPWPGVALVVAAALFAGLPWLGGDLGGGVTLFAVAAMWWAFRVRGRFRIPEAAVVAVTAVAGAVLLVFLHRLAPAPSHVTRAVEEAGSFTGILPAFWERLSLNLAATARTPAVWLALLAVPVALWIALRRIGPFGPMLESNPAWRHAVLALAGGAILGYLLNDTYGMAAVAFIYLAFGLVYPALRRAAEGPGADRLPRL
jgi:hypothetical protein